MNYEHDMRIDESALDVEWLEQPTLMMRYAQHTAAARRELELAKENLDIVKAELDKEIRTNPSKYGLTKPTEGAVTAVILTTSEYEAASQRMIKAKYEADIAQSAVRAIDARKDALENLVRLHGLQYFAGPKVPRDLSFEARRVAEAKQVNAAVSAGLKRNK